MGKRLTTGEKVFTVFNYLILTLLCAVMVYPYLHSIALSFSDKYEVVRGSVGIWPKQFNTDSYRYIFANKLFWTALRVTVTITAVGTLFSVLMTCLFAYPLASRHFRLRNVLTVIVIITMFFEGGLIPTFMLYKQLGLLNKIYVYIIPSCISTWSLIILRNFFQQIPVEMEESATIDGANDLDILFRIIIPIALPSIATITLWYVVSYWNTFSTSIYYTTDRNLRSLQVVLRGILMNEESITAQSNLTESMRRMTPEALKSAWIMCVTVPILVIYPFLQKYFVKGVIVGALKG